MNVFDAQISQLRGPVGPDLYKSVLYNHGIGSLLGGVPCYDPESGFRYFDPSTEFVSACVTSLAGAFVAVVFAIPLLLRSYQLMSHERGPATVAGQLTRILAMLVPVFKLTEIWWQQMVPTPLEWLVVCGAALASFLHWVQDGRVVVCSSELLLYWLFTGIAFTADALDAWMRRVPGAFAVISAAVLTVLILILEVVNPKRGNQPGGPVEFDRVNIFEKISLGFVNQLLYKGSRTKIERKDLPRLPQGLNAVNANDKLRRALDKWGPSWRYRVIFSILEVLRSEITALILFDTLTEAVTYLQPSILSLFLNSLERYRSGEGQLFSCFYFAVLVGVFPMVSTSLQNVVNLMASYTYVISRTSLTSLIYSKSLGISPGAREKYDSAKIMNLINVDTEQIDGVASVLPNLVSAPLALVMSTYQLYKFIGRAMFAAVAFYVVFVPYTGWVSKVISGMYPEIMAIKDERTKVTSNAFRNIKSLKLYAWERPFYDRIASIRTDKELAKQRRMQIIFATLQASWTVLGDLVAASIFVTYLWLRMGELNPGVVFPTLLLLQIVTFPFMSLPMTITSIARAVTSQTRINELLVEPDQTYENYYRQPSSVGGLEWHEETIRVDGATVSWNGELTDDKIALRDIDLVAAQGDLVCITGRVGAGKTALLKALAGELAITNGSFNISGGIAYCSQEPWLQNSTLRDNVLFGKKYDSEFYAQTLEACDLQADIAQLAKKDDTDVGERGISLSGGQKARVALARAVYARAEIYLLDDVLSAVDEHVAAHLIERLFSKNGLLAGKTIVLATNNVKVLSHASQIVALESKAVVEKSSFREVVEKREDSVIFRLIREFGKSEDLDQAADDIEDRRTVVSQASSTKKLFRKASIDPEEIERALNRKHDDEDEDKHEAVSLSIFKRYFEVVGRWYLAIALSMMVSSVVITNSSNIWVGFMSNHNFGSLGDAKFYIAVYLVIALMSALSIFGTLSWFIVLVCLSVSRALHNNMLWNVMRTPMSFFDLTPLGRIINRFTGDMASLDNVLPSMLYYVARSIMNAIMGIVTVLTGSPVVAIVVIPLLLLGNMYRKMYVPSSRQVSRMASSANSPILSHIEESLKGAAIVRAFDRTTQFIDLYDSRIDYWIELAFLKQNLGRWLGFRIQAMTCVLQLTAALSLTVLVSRGKISVGYCAVVLHFASRVGIMVQQTLNMLAQLEVAGVSLERILEYIDLTQEAPDVIPERKPVDEWPARGEIIFDSFSARYNSDGPDVLKNLSLSINAKEKIGIVGRTGSGKSTLTLALFRILEANSGHIEIDKIDTSQLGLHDLRSHLAIIPQDAQIFDGTLRENLDPLATADDARLWEILELCHLKTHFESLGTGLDTLLSDGGDNLSRGQAQLVCLGRALLHDTKVLVMDEATASVDVETDRVVQQTIRSQFKDRTIVTIAHRLNTIMDSDRILVLDYGVLREFDTPQRLLEQRGLFWSLVNAEPAAKPQATESSKDTN